MNWKGRYCVYLLPLLSPQGSLYVCMLDSLLHVQTISIVHMLVITLFLLVLPASSVKKQILGSKTCS